MTVQKQHGLYFIFDAMGRKLSTQLHPMAVEIWLNGRVARWVEC